MKIATHSGSFHTDEVFAVAALLLKFKDSDVTVIRSRDPEVIRTADIVVDVGGEYDPERFRFDHHQGGVAPRDNGIPYASFGLVWKEYGEAIAETEQAAQSIDRQLVQPIDAADNGHAIYESIVPGVHPYTIQSLAHSLYATWEEEDSSDAGFSEMLVIARRIIEREVEHVKSRIKGRQKFDECYRGSPDARIVTLDDKYSFEEYMDSYPEILYVLYRNKTEDAWHAKAARDSVHTFESRKPFPESWRGLRGEALIRETGVPDAVFCHLSGHLAVAKSHEGIAKLVALALAA